ncbi:MAG: 3-hydroxyacyl-CoA dehydrogenase [Myxococcota bacterium]|nr:3-hydroxyacyl-CoA dehydrogenase [Myxococcota bacterium]
MEIQSTVAIVTGAASGLGRATALRLGRGGARVVVADLNEEAGQQVASELGDNGAFVKVDVTSEADVNAALDVAAERFGGVTAAINCAGIAIAKRVLNKEGGSHDLGLFSKVLQVNVGGTFNVMRLCAERMAKAEPNAHGERGVFVNTASVAAYDGQIGQVAYSASKGAIVGMTLPMARDLARTGIRTCTIAPGVFKTALLAGLPDKVQATLGEMVPFPARLGDPDEYAQLACAIVTNPMLNGEVIRLDGALRLPPR